MAEKIYGSCTARFLKYIAWDTRSEDGKDNIPSTSGQLLLAEELVSEMKAMGVSDVRMDEHGYVYGRIPANTEKKAPALGFIAHMDTSPAFSGKNVQPRFAENYDGRDICLNEEKDIWLKTEDFPELKEYAGQTIITADGTTLLGADDKAGIAEIMTMAEWFLTHPEAEHGTICIAFTPDEEVGRGADLFDVSGFGADAAYTVDGGALGELEYENFNAASGHVTVHGANIHPGSAKNKMKNALLMAMEFQSLLPAAQNPMYTEGYEGFFHLDRMSGCVEEAVMDYIIRDHDRDKFQQKKELFLQAADFMNRKYGEGTIEAKVRDSYYNMKEKIEPHMYLIDRAKAAMEKLGITPVTVPIRGGTDGARLSFMGLPCPNLCTGGHNYHGKYEYIPVQSMEKTAELLVGIAKSFVEEPC
ncbi:MAG: peptidase T [Enterocloster sp.]